MFNLYSSIDVGAFPFFLILFLILLLIGIVISIVIDGKVNVNVNGVCCEPMGDP